MPGLDKLVSFSCALLLIIHSLLSKRLQIVRGDFHHFTLRGKRLFEVRVFGELSIFLRLGVWASCQGVVISTEALLLSISE